MDSSHPYEKSGTGETFQSATLESQADAIGAFSDWVTSHQAEKNIQSLIIFSNRDSTAFFGNRWDAFSGLIGQYDGQQRWFKPSWFKFQEKTGVTKWSPQLAALQANNGKMWTWSTIEGGVDRSQGMEAGTSPSIAGLTHGGIWGNGGVIAFHSSNGHVFRGTAARGFSDLGVSMAAGSSPSVVGVVHGNYVVAVRGSNGNLWTWTPLEGSLNRGLGMASGTSPSVTAVPAAQRSGANGYAVAFQANTGTLWTMSPDGSFDRLLGMAAGSSPATETGSAPFPAPPNE